MKLQILLKTTSDISQGTIEKVMISSTALACRMLRQRKISKNMQNYKFVNPCSRCLGHCMLMDVDLTETQLGERQVKKKVALTINQAIDRKRTCDGIVVGGR